MMWKLTLLLVSCALGNYAFGQNIGIGEPNPQYTLDVNGQISVNDFIYHNDDPDTYFGFSGNDQYGLTAGGKSILSANGTTNELIINPGTDNTTFIILADAVDHLLHADPVTKRVGIGQATPSYLFDVAGDFRIMGDAVDHLFFADASTNSLGVGTSTPSYLMDVAGDFRIMGDAVDHLFYADAANNTIGVGTSTPAYLMDVAGDFRIMGDAVDHLVFADVSTGKVGIGTSTPSDLLTVEGKARVKELKIGPPAVTTSFKAMQTGQALVTSNSISGEPKQAIVTFPGGAFTTAPNIIATPRILSGLNNTGTFSVTVIAVNSLGMTLSVDHSGDEPWNQDILISWMAWE